MAPRPPSFGRRTGASPAPRPAERAPAAAPPQDIAADIVHQPDTDAELEDWKRQRRWQPPWRQISLTASLCFGIASLVLPDSVNDKVQWLLYGLAAASLYAGLRKRPKA